MITVQDPTNYPFVFNLPRKIFSIIDNKTAIVTFLGEENKILKGGFYFYDGLYLLDVNHNSNDETSFIGDQKKSIFEFITDSPDLSSCNFNIKIWLNDTSFIIKNNSEVFTLRQIPWLENKTKITFFVSNSMKKFNAVNESGVDYYPSVSVNSTFHPEYYVDESISSTSVKPGESSDVSIISVENYGVLSILFVFSLSWYYDSDRTLLVTSPPSNLLTLSPTSFVARIIFPKSSSFYKKGNVSSDGLAVFDGIYTRDYILQNGLNYGSFSYSGLDEETNLLFINKEEEVIINDNGYCIKTDTPSQIYLLE